MPVFPFAQRRSGWTALSLVPNPDLHARADIAVDMAARPAVSNFGLGRQILPPPQAPNPRQFFRQAIAPVAQSAIPSIAPTTPVPAAAQQSAIPQIATPETPKQKSTESGWVSNPAPMTTALPKY